MRAERHRAPLLLAAALALGGIASTSMAADLEFHAPSSIADAAPALRDLANRFIPVYQNPDPDRYLADLSAVQMVAGNFGAADESRQSLRERRQRTKGRPIERSVLFDIYAHALATQEDGRVSFADAFAKSYREAAGRLNDRDAYALNSWLHGSNEVYGETLQKLLDQQRTSDSIGEPAAFNLFWAYLQFEAFRSVAPLVGALTDEDDRRRYEVQDGISIETPNGGFIAATAIRPRGMSKPLPALLEYTIYESPDYAKECAAHGYVGVVAYSPGVHGTSDPVIPYQNEGANARVVIDWISRQSWSDGRVGMYGVGYSGFTAWAAAKRPSAALKAIATSAANAPGVDVPMAGSIFQNSAYRWSLYVTDKKPADRSEYYDDSLWHSLNQKWYARGARYRDLGRIHGKANPIFIRWLNHPSYDRFWQELIPFHEQFAKINIPALTLSGYYAGSQPGALYYFIQHLRYNPHADHTLLIGPYDDAVMQRGPLATLQAYPVDAAALIDVRELQYQWFDHVLKGAPSPSLLAARVNYEVMGANQWRHAASIDAMGKSVMRFYLDPSTPRDTHRLNQHKNPRVSAVLQTVELKTREDGAWVPSLDLISRSLAPHNHVLYESDPLQKPVEVSGPFSARLDFIVNKMDVDLNVILYEHQPNGDYVRLFSPTDEIRASYARDRIHRRLLKAGEREVLRFRSERMTARLLQTGSTLVMVLGVGKRPDREINYGTGNDVSAESIDDGTVPIKIRWFSDSYIEVPVVRAR